MKASVFFLLTTLSVSVFAQVQDSDGPGNLYQNLKEEDKVIYKLGCMEDWKIEARNELSQLIDDLKSHRNGVRLLSPSMAGGDVRI